MNKKNDRRSTIALFSILGVLVIWLALLLAPYSEGGLPEIIAHLSDITAHPYQIRFCSQTPKLILIFLGIYALGIIYYLSTRKNYRRGEEHGSASWGDAGKLNRKYRQRPPTNNRILTQNVRMGINAQKHGRNLNTLVLGASGTRKSRGYALPNLMQANTSFIVTDPKGELLYNTGSFLLEEGYRLKVLDLIHMERSHCYNPFAYLEKPEDVQQMVTNFFRASGVKNSGGDMKFWEDMAQTYMKAMVYFLIEEAPPEEQNFSMILYLINADQVPEEGAGDDTAPSPTETLFYQLEIKNPDSLAVQYYRSSHQSAGKTMQSIQVTLISHLEKFALPAMAALTRTDEMELDRIGREKTALFCVIPDNDTSFNFLVSVLYTQLFQKLFRVADDEYHGALPVPVHFLLDEFANVAMPDDFDKMLSVMRSRDVSVSVIVQTLSSLKSQYKDNWETITGNMDELLFLGGNEQTTTEYLSKRLGKETIDTNSYGRSRGRNGSYSTNYQITGRELMTPDEIGQMDNKYALLFIRGEKPVQDLKYDLNRHPNASRIIGTKSSRAKPYLHGDAPLAQAQITITQRRSTESVLKQSEPDVVSDHKYELLSEEEVAAFSISKEEN